MNSRNVLRISLRIALGMSASMLGAVSVLAQSAPTAGTAATPAAVNLTKVVVTGSRIPETAISLPQPVIRIERQQIEASGFQNVSQFLQNLTAAGPSINSQYNDTENGEETINLHGLGANRTLVLVNGQRWVSELDGVVDLTTIPLAVVDHIEVLLDGASTIYGSEAIAGVINIVTVKNFKGTQAQAYYGEYDGHGDGGGWDGLTKKYNFTTGTSDEHSSILFSAGYSDQDPVFAGNRTISKEPTIGRGVQNGFPSAGGRFVVLNLTGASQLPNGCTPASVVCDVTGPNSNDPSGFHASTTADNYNDALGQALMTPSERWYAYTQGHYDLASNLTFHFMATYRRRNSTRYLFPFPMLLGIQGSATADGLAMGVAQNAPGNPFGVDLVPYFPGTPQFGEWCQRFGSPNCTSQFDVAEFIGGAPVGLGQFQIPTQKNVYYFNGGLDGDFMFGGNEWDWNADYVYSQGNRAEQALNLRNDVNLQEALSYGCSSDPTCTPINIFDGLQNITPAAANYVNVTSISQYTKILRDYNINLTGEFLNQWYAGPWGVAIGYENDKDEGSFLPDALTGTGNLPTGAKQPTSGAKSTHAEYVEFRVPLARDVFLAKNIEVDLADRWSQFYWTGIGNIFDAQTSSVTSGLAQKSTSAATPRATFKWQPSADLLLRGTWAEGFRTPSISELFQGTSGANFIGITDPCNLDPTTTPRSNLPPGCNGNFHVVPTSGLVQNTTGGNSQLNPEKATTRTIGFVVSPSGLAGLNVSADYYKTEVDGVIQGANPQFLINSCFIDQNPDSCAHIDLSGSGDNTAVGNIITLAENTGLQRVEGWDVSVRYAFPMTSVGEFTAALSGNFSREDVFCQAGGACQDVAGTAGPNAAGVGTGDALPRHQYHFALNWNEGQWSATYNLTLLGPVWEDCALSLANGEGLTAAETAAGEFNNTFCSNIVALNPDGTIETGSNHIGTTVYQDVQGSYAVAAWNTTFTFGIQNLLDKQPPIGMTGGAFNFYPTYRIPGRFFYGRVTVRF